jgi:hypothetical protein
LQALVLRRSIPQNDEGYLKKLIMRILSKECDEKLLYSKKIKKNIFLKNFIMREGMVDTEA